MAAETQYTANTSVATISTANTNLNGTGTLGTVITAASNGTLIKTITIKAQTSTTEGMVRLFVYDGTNTKLIYEVLIPAISKSAFIPAFETVIPLNFSLKSSWVLKASTQKGETFNVIAEGLNWTYYDTSVRSDTTKNTADNGAVSISTANPNLDGTGTIGDAFTAGSNGDNIQSITITSPSTTVDGMVRLFLYDGTNTKLWKEIVIPAITPSATMPAFNYKIRFNDGFALKSGWHLKASTEIAATFYVITESLGWAYPA